MPVAADEHQRAFTRNPGPATATGHFHHGTLSSTQPAWPSSDVLTAVAAAADRHAAGGPPSATTAFTQLAVWPQIVDVRLICVWHSVCDCYVRFL